MKLIYIESQNIFSFSVSVSVFFLCVSFLYVTFGYNLPRYYSNDFNTNTVLTLLLFSTYRKVTNNSMSHLLALFRMFMKKKCDVYYLLWPFGEKLIFAIVYYCDSTVLRYWIFSNNSPISNSRTSFFLVFSMYTIFSMFTAIASFVQFHLSFDCKVFAPCINLLSSNFHDISI